MTGTRENGIRGSRDWDGLQGSRLALQSVRESVSWENMKGWGVSSSETDQRRSHTGDMESRSTTPTPKPQGASRHNGRNDTQIRGLMEHGGGWVLGRQDGFGLTLEPGLASRRGRPRFEGEASGCLPFSFQRLLGQRGRGGSGGGEEGGEGRGSGTGGCRPSVRLSTEVWTGEHAAGGPQAQGLASDVQVGRGRLERKGWRETLTPSTEKGVPEGPDPRQGGRAIAESRWRPRGPA